MTTTIAVEGSTDELLAAWNNISHLFKDITEIRIHYPKGTPVDSSIEEKQEQLIHYPTYNPQCPHDGFLEIKGKSQHYHIIFWAGAFGVGYPSAHGGAYDCAKIIESTGKMNIPLEKIKDKLREIDQSITILYP